MGTRWAGLATFERHFKGRSAVMEVITGLAGIEVQHEKTTLFEKAKNYHDKPHLSKPSQVVFGEDAPFMNKKNLHTRAYNKQSQHPKTTYTFERKERPRNKPTNQQ